MIKKMVVSAASAFALASFGFTSSAAAAANAPVAAAEPSAPSHIAAQDLEGDWGGKLMGNLRLVLHIKKSSAGEYSAVFESVDQEHTMIPVDKLQITSDHMALSIASIHVTYDAKWDGASKSWVGTWTQSQGLPLTLARINSEGAKAKKP